MEPSEARPGSSSSPAAGAYSQPEYKEAQAILEAMASASHWVGSTPQPLLRPWKGEAGSAELRYRALVERIPAVTFVAGLDDTVPELYISPQIEALLGFSQEEWLENPFLWYAQLHPDDRHRWAAEFAQTCSTGALFRSDYRVLTRDGRVVWVHGECQVIQDDAGFPRFLQGIAFDITASKEAEEVLRRSHDELEARVHQRTAELEESERRLQAAKEVAEDANRSKDHFLAVLSHELRTPLTPVLGAVQMMEQDETLPTETRETVSMIRRNIELEARIIDDLLDLTRISRGKIELRSEVVDAHASLRHALEVWHQQIDAKGLEVTLHLSARKHHVQADPARLQQVYWNLIGNAVKFTPQGGQIILRSFSEGETKLVVQVADKGIGISADLLPRLFNAFEQGERTVTRRYGGLGLGLSISKALMEMHNGTLTASSEGIGRGATFTLSIRTVPAPAAQQGARPRLGGSPGKPVSILLVEDHEDTQRVMSRLLRSSGYSVSIAGSVRAALELADAHTFDLMISDLGLPDGSGMDLIGQLLAKRPIRAIALSGYGMEEDIRQTKAAGFIAHLTKPVNLQRLENVIREALA